MNVPFPPLKSLHIFLSMKTNTTCLFTRTHDICFSNSSYAFLISVKEHFANVKKEKKYINRVILMMNDDVVLPYETQSSINTIEISSSVALVITKDEKQVKKEGKEPY